MSTKQRFSREGFQQLPSSNPPRMGNPNDATIDIPLTTVPTKTGACKSDNNDPNPLGINTELSEQKNNEKAGLFRRPVAGRRKAAKDSAGNKSDDEEEGTLTHMGKVYHKILSFSIVTRYFLYVLPIALIIAVPIVIGATAAQNAKLGGVRIVWLFTWIEIVWLSLWVSKLAAISLPWVFQFLCGIVSSGTRKYALVLKSLEIPLSLSGWALASMATFMPIMTRNPDQRREGNAAKKDWEVSVRNVLLAALLSSLLFLVERLLIQLISIGYHRKQFDSKIKDSKHNIHLMGLLYDASRSLFPAYCPEFAEEDYIINDSIHLTDTRTGTNKTQKSGSSTPMRLLQNVGRVGDKITSAFGHIAQEVTGKQVFNPTSAHSVVVEALEKNKSSEALAKRLWMSFVTEGKDALYQDDIIEVLGTDRRDEATECFGCLDRDGNGDISLDEMILTVCEIARERHSIANSLHDVDQAIHVLDGLLCTVVFVLCVFVFVGFFSPNSTTTLVTAGTTLLSLSFVFATSTQEVLGSCIFLFVKHPFDVLDRVDIGDDQLIVEHISLLYTTFKKVNTHKLTQVPNIVLNSLWIQNVSRSRAMKEQLLLFINFDTTLEDIHLLKKEMQAFVLAKDNNRDFQPDIDVEVTGIHEMNKLELRVEIKHKSNWANETVRAARRSKFMCALVLALRKIPIYAPGGGDSVLGSSDKPTYSVTVSDEQAAAAREAFAAKKEGKRLVPSQKPEEKIADGQQANVEKPDDKTTEVTMPIIPLGQGTSSSRDIPSPHDSATPSPLRYRTSTFNEALALTALNDRNPAADTLRDASDPIDADSGSSTPQDRHRSADLEEVRGLLNRQSTRGRRKPQISSTIPIVGTHSVPPIAENQMPTPRMEVEYNSYPPQTLDPYLQQQQHSPGLHSSRVSDMSQLPQIPVPGSGNPYLHQQQHSPGLRSSRISEMSQLPPQVQIPVPGSGNAFAEQAREEQRQREQRQQQQLPPHPSQLSQQHQSSSSPREPPPPLQRHQPQGWQ